jgi:hypothetical protein
MGDGCLSRFRLPAWGNREHGCLYGTPPLGL